MDDQLLTVFSSMIEDMPDPPTWDEVSNPAVTTNERREPEHHRFGIAIALASAAAVVAVIAAPLTFLRSSEPNAGADGGTTPAVVGDQFTAPEHLELSFSQQLTLTCSGMETVDDGGFDSFDISVWIDHPGRYVRLGFEYPDGSTHDLILQGGPDGWQGAWGSGSDQGRSAGCRESDGNTGFNQSIAGWAFQDASPLWFEEYLTPVRHTGDGIIVNREGSPTPAEQTGPNVYTYEAESPDGTRLQVDYTLDDAGLRIVEEKRHIVVPGEFEATATLEVDETGPATLPPHVFDTSTFAPLWSRSGIVTTSTSVG